MFFLINNLFFYSKLACQKRLWTLFSEYQRHWWWWRWWSSSSCCGTKTRTHKERKSPTLSSLDSKMIVCKISYSYFTFWCTLCAFKNNEFIWLPLVCCVVQVYTRSVIDPIPAPSTCVDGDTASKAADRQKKKGKMSDEEIMDKLSK